MGLMRFLTWLFLIGLFLVLTWLFSIDLFLVSLPFAMAVIAAGMLLFLVYRSKNNKDPSQPSAKTEPSDPPSHNPHLAALTLLYLELKQQYHLGHLSEERYNYYCEQVEVLLNKQLNFSKNQRQAQLELAWLLLKKQIGCHLEPFPWHSVPETIRADELQPSVESKEELVSSQNTMQSVSTAEKLSIDEKEVSSAVPTVEPNQTADLPASPSILPEEPPAVAPSQKEVTAEENQILEILASPSVLPEEPPASPQPFVPSQKEVTAEESQPLEIPASPSVLPEEPPASPQPAAPTQRKTTTWLSRVFNREFIAHVLISFLWQNLGWFIGGFCFISGSIFLVTYTTGFAKTVTVFVILSFYTLLLFWGSYQIRRRYPKLLTTSYVLATLAVLLVPLDLALATRLIQNAIPLMWLVSLMILGALIVIVGLTIALRLASGMILRHLQSEHPYLLMTLASLQLVIPLIYLIPHWLVLAGLHVGLLSVLGYALRRFSQQWLYMIFIEQQQVAYYAAGTLVYAAVVSFIHSIWGSGITLPAGYAGPFLMTLCWLLLHVDVQFKRWVHKQALLNHFSFVIYGLSVVAIFSAWVGPVPLVLTLMMGSVVYGMMLWKYLTLPPLYLLLACLSGLYGLLILQYFPYHWYFLLSLPGLGSLLWLHRFAQQRESVALASICCRVILTLGAGLLVWSLYHASPSFNALSTALIATVVASYYLQKALHSCQFTVVQPYQYYILTGLVTVTLAYAPPYGGLSWATQFSGNLVILSILWSVRGLLIRTDPGPASVFFSSALLSLMVSVILIALYHPSSLPWLLFAVSLVLLGLSLTLYSRTLFYAMLIGLGMAGILFKHYYLPDSSGRGVTLIALGIWMLLWWLNYRFVYLPERSLLGKTETTEPSVKKLDLSLFGILPLSSNTYANHLVLVKPPLEQTLVLLWLVGLLQTLKPVIPLLLMNNLEPFWTQSWGIALIWNAVITVLIAGHLRWLKLVPLSLMLLMVGGLWVWSPVQVEWFFCLSVIAAALIWSVTLFLLSRSLSAGFAFLGWQEPDNFQQKMEYIIYWTVVVIILVSLVGIGLLTFEPLLGQPDISVRMPLVISLMVMVLLAGWAGWRYQSPSHSYVVIWGSLSSLLVLGLGLIPWSAWLKEPSIWFVSTLLVIGLSILAQRIANSSLGSLYTRPLYIVAYLLYLLTLVSLFWLWQQNTSFEPFELIGLLILLASGQLPLLRSLSRAAMIRGVGVALLLSLAFFHWASFHPQDNLIFLTLLWAFVLWGVGNYGLPWFNKRWSQWAIEPYFWPIFGLGLMVTVFSWVSWQQESLNWQTVIPVTLYLILMLRNTYWGWLPWLVGFALTVSGLVVSLELSSHSLLAFIFGITLSSNLLLWLSWFIWRYEATPWQFRRLSQPLLIWSLLVISFQLLGLSLITIGELFNLTGNLGLKTLGREFLIVWAILLNLSYFHLLSRQKHSLFTHVLMLSLLNTVLWVLNAWFNVSLSLSLWTAGSLGGLLFYAKMHYKVQPLWISTLSTWLSFSFIAALLSLIIIPIPSTNERLLVLALLTGLSFSFGWFNISNQAKNWLVGSVVLFWVFLHMIWLTEWSQAQLLSRLPWYALQNALLAWSTFWLITQEVGITQARREQFRWLFTGVAPLLASLAIFLLGLAHSQWVLALWNDQPSSMAFSDHFVIFFTHVLLLGLWWRYAPGRATSNTTLVYGLALLSAWLGIYLRLLWMGFAPPNVWDAVALIGSSYMLLVLQLRFPNDALSWLTVQTGVVSAVLSLVLMPGFSLAEQLWVLALLTGLSFSFGWFNLRNQAQIWLVGSAIWFWLFLHVIWLTEWSQAQLFSRLPWYALQNALLAWGMFWLRTLEVGVTQPRQEQFRWLLTELAPSLAGLSLLFILLSEHQILLALWGGHPSLITLNNLALLLAHSILIGSWWQHHPGRANQNATFVYGLAVLIAWLSIYLRLSWVGLAPLSVWDTAVLMGSSYVLLAIWHLYPTYPLYYLTLVIPALAVLTVPLQLESVPASSALIAAAVLYLLMPRRSQQSLPLYLGLLALNIGFYLWIPGLAHDYKLLQLYTVPAAISLLFMLQLHHLELKPSTLNAIRLVALSTLYASATLDVFLQESLGIFMLALLLSLMGIVLGIALRIRAFLYSGTVFLVLNVVGQLIQFYPEERLGKAIVLMVLGGLITGGMIWFNIQREALLERVRTMQANLATWA